MQFKLLCVSKPLRGWAQQACQDYEKRLQGFINFNTNEVPPAPLAKNQGKNGITQNKEQEAQSLLAASPKRSIGVTLDESGRHYTTKEFANLLQQWQLAAQDVVFYIGGADGLDKSLLRECQYCLSLSNMTLPHQIARLVFTEQCYRAVSLWHNHPYHRNG